MTTGFTRRDKGKVAFAAGAIYQDGVSSLAVYKNAGAPTSGTSGTLAKIAPIGALLVDTTGARLYINTNTVASPTWTIQEASGGQVLVPAANSITAFAGGGQSSATALTAQVNRITTCATTADSVRLPASAAGLIVEIVNAGAASAQVYGASTDTIDEVATGTGVSLAAAARAHYFCVVAGKWHSISNDALTLNGATFAAPGAIGGTTPAAGAFTTLSATGLTSLATATTISAAGTTRSNATALTKTINKLTTVASGTGVILPASAVGQIVIIENGGANAVQVYGAGSDTIDTVAGSTGVVLTNAKRCLYICVAANTYISAQLGVISA